MLQTPGDVVLVERGGPRSIVMNCPDGCGETLTVNLDRRTGKAWRFYERSEGISLYPSVWRATGCRSHFIVWENGIFWQDGRDRPRTAWEYAALTEAVKSRLSSDRFTPIELIADALQEVPWTIDSVCRRLADEGLAEEGRDDLRGAFRLLR